MSQERQKKKDQFTAENGKSRGIVMVAAATLIVLSAVAGWLILGQGASDGYAALKAQNGEVRIDLNAVDDGNAHYFSVKEHGTDINFFVVKSVDGVMRAAFDACDVCYKEKMGYSQDGNVMVCNNCGMRFRTDLVNEVKGGCNPAPLNRKIENGNLIIDVNDIVDGKQYFNFSGKV